MNKESGRDVEAENIDKIKGKMARRRRITEIVASVGLSLVALGLVVPFLYFDNAALVSAFKWVFSAGAVIYTVARGVNTNEPGDSMRVRRLRRMEMWAGFAICIGAAFWWYNENKFGPYGVTLKLLHETILFTLTGALIQIVASCLLVTAIRKQRTQPSDSK